MAPHTSPSRARYGVPFLNFSMKMNHDILRARCIGLRELIWLGRSSLDSNQYNLQTELLFSHWREKVNTMQKIGFSFEGPWSGSGSVDTKWWRALNIYAYFLKICGKIWTKIYRMSVLMRNEVMVRRLEQSYVMKSWEQQNLEGVFVIL